MVVRHFRVWLLVGAFSLAGQASAAAGGSQTNGETWSSLSAPQRGALAPLARDWDHLPADNRRKWLEVASRFPAMTPQQRERIQERMTEWSRLSPEQRGEARANFQESKRLKLEDRQAKWEAYMALPQDERHALAERARSPSTGAGASPSGTSKSLRAASVDAQAPKSNIVQGNPTRSEIPRTVSPSLVQSSTGATTSLVTARPAPPTHQPAGQPKIAAGSSTLDRITLLPKPAPHPPSNVQGSDANKAMSQDSPRPANASSATAQ
jgi:hypothetical protein